MMAQNVTEEHRIKYNERQQAIQKVERKIEDYTKIETSLFSENVVLELLEQEFEKARQTHQHTKTEIEIDDYDYSGIDEEDFLKAYFRKKYFNEHPEDKQVYEAQVMNLCENGGFEDGFIGFTGYSAYGIVDGYSGGGCSAVGTFNSGVDDMSNPLDMNPHFLTFELTNTGQFDPYFPSIPKVNSGLQAIRINGEQDNFGVNELKYLVDITSYTEFISFYSAVVMENPLGHEDFQPIFHVQARDFSTNLLLDEYCLESDYTNPQFVTKNCPGNGQGDSCLVAKPWDCHNLRVDANSGDIIELTFTMTDCGLGAHWAYAYIDDICASCASSPCSEPGAVILDDFQYCLDEDTIMQVSGSFTPPESLIGLNCETGVYSAINLEIVRGAVVENVLTNGIVDLNNNTFTFEVTPSDFPPITGAGGYDFRANVTFDFSNSSQIILSKRHTVPGPNNDYQEGTVRGTDDPDCCIEEDATPIFIPELNPARSCDQTNTSYEVDINFNVDNVLRLGVCAPNVLPDIISPDGTVIATDFSITPGADQDQVFMTLVLSPTGGSFPLIGMEIIFTLCDKYGTAHCYKARIQGTECADCAGPIVGDIACVSDQPGAYIYEGEMEIDVSTFTGLQNVTGLCTPDIVSRSLQGLMIDIDPSNDPIYKISYSYATSNQLMPQASFVICFTDGPNKFCLEVDLQVTDDCDEQDDCGAIWLPKTMNCTSEDSENVYWTFDFDVEMVPGYNICPGGLEAYMTNGAEITINSYQVSGGDLQLNVTITLPQGYDPSILYELIIVLCQEGSVDCFRIPFRLICEPENIPPPNAIDGMKAVNTMMVYPNPAIDGLNVLIAKDWNYESMTLRLMDMNGRLVLEKDYFENIKTIHLSTEALNSGVYMLSVSTDSGKQQVKRVVIMQ